MRRFLYCLLVPLCLTGATYTVKPGGGGDYTTIQACATAAVAGDTCAIDPGTYDERVVASHSGVSGQPITFRGATSTKPVVRGWTINSVAYVTLRGVEITSAGMSTDASSSILVTGSDHVRIESNYIHDTTATAIRANSSATDPKATNLYIGGNLIAGVGSPNSGPPNYTGGRMAAIICWCDNSLIENNDVSYCGDFTRTLGKYNVVRRNTWHNAYVSESTNYDGTVGSGDHIDGWQSFCGGTLPAPEAANYTLLEGNYEHDVPDINSHFALVNDTDACGGTTTVIARHNTAYHVGSGFYEADANLQSMADHHKVYNNTVVSELQPDGGHASTDFRGTTTASFIGNLLYDAANNSSPYYGYLLRAGDATSAGDYNLGFQSSGTVAWSAPINSESHHVLNQDPAFVGSTNFHLQSSSPARGAGGPLTTVAGSDVGSGTSLVLTDAHFFQDGWAGVTADAIRVGATTTAQILSINYATNTVTLTGSISRVSGDPVYLYKDSSGNVVLNGAVPDIGAYQYVGTHGFQGSLHGNAK